jgi:Tol biopolymer transport system component
MWLPNGKGLLVAVKGPDLESKTQIWSVSVPQGKAQRVTNDLGLYGDVDLTRDGSTLATVQGKIEDSVWVAAGGKSSSARPVGSDGPSMFPTAWLPDGRILYVTRGELWVMKVDGTERTRFLLDRKNIERADLCGDHYVVFSQAREDKTELWRVRIDGTDQLRLAVDADTATCSPDGEFVFYGWNGKIWKMPVEGGTPSIIVEGLISSGAGISISPNGRLLAYILSQPASARMIAIVPIAGGAPTRTFEQPRDADEGELQWSPNGKGIQYLRAHNIWEQPVRGGTARKVTDFESDPSIFNFRWSTDGKQLLFNRSIIKTDVVLISHFH